MPLTWRDWDPFSEFEALHREVNRLFEEWGLGGWQSPFSRFSFLPGLSARAYPLLNVTEDDGAVYVEALAPGLNPDTLSITIVQNELTLSGEKPELDEEVKAEAFHRSERAAGRFVRTLTLPVEVDQEKTQAEYRNGILCLTLPKAEAAKPRQIAVTVR